MIQVLANSDYFREFSKYTTIQDQFFLFVLEKDGTLEKKFYEVSKDPGLFNVNFQSINCVKNHQYCALKGIFLYPSALYISHSKEIVYDWDYASDDLLRFALKMQNPIEFLENTEELNAFTNAYPITYVLKYSKFDNKRFIYLPWFESISEKFKTSKIHFAFSPFFEENKMFQGKIFQPFIQQLSPIDNYNPILSFPFTYDEIVSFIENHKCFYNIKLEKSNWKMMKNECLVHKIVGISFIDENNPEHLQQVEMIRYFALNEPLLKPFLQFAHINLLTDSFLAKKFKIFDSYSFIIIDYRSSEKLFYFGDLKFRVHDEIYDLFESIRENSTLAFDTRPLPARTLLQVRYLIFPLLLILLVYYYFSKLK